MRVVFHMRNMCLVGWAFEYLLAVGGVSFGKVWEVWPRWRDYIPRGGLKAFTALPHSQFALFALCLLLKVQAFCSVLLPCRLLATRLACLVDSAAISQNQLLLPQSFSVTVFSAATEKWLPQHFKRNEPGTNKNKHRERVHLSAIPRTGSSQTAVDGQLRGVRGMEEASYCWMGIGFLFCIIKSLETGRMASLDLTLLSHLRWFIYRVLF